MINSSTCNKVSFDSPKEADARAGAINRLNAKHKRRNKNLRSYKCSVCSKYHLTSMSVHEFKFTSDVNYRNKVREKAFIGMESKYWESYFGIE